MNTRRIDRIPLGIRTAITRAPNTGATAQYIETQIRKKTLTLEITTKPTTRAEWLKLLSPLYPPPAKQTYRDFGDLQYRFHPITILHFATIFLTHQQLETLRPFVTQLNTIRTTELNCTTELKPKAGDYQIFFRITENDEIAIKTLRPLASRTSHNSLNHLGISVHSIIAQATSFYKMEPEVAIMLRDTDPASHTSTWPTRLLRDFSNLIGETCHIFNATTREHAYHLDYDSLNSVLDGISEALSETEFERFNDWTALLKMILTDEPAIHHKLQKTYTPTEGIKDSETKKPRKKPPAPDETTTVERAPETDTDANLADLII